MTDEPPAEKRVRAIQLERKSPHEWDDVHIEPGESRAVELHVSESYSGLTLPIQAFIRRGLRPGPAVFVTAAIHGDEINGTGAIRQLIADETLVLESGTLIMVPVVNILGFDRHSRYLPDRKDLNRCFPGSRKGSIAGRMARLIFEEIVGRCDFGIDLHTAAVRRTNFPNVRANTANPAVRELAESFGAEIILSGQGPNGSLRREACRAGCPTIILEAGEVWKVEPDMVEFAVRGVHNVLSNLGMIDKPRIEPAYMVTIRRTKWVRAEKGGFLQFHVTPGDLVEEGVSLAATSSLVGTELGVVSAPFDSLVLGMTTLPAASPGDPVCHLGLLDDGNDEIARIRARLPSIHLHERVRDTLASQMMTFDRPAEPTAPAAPTEPADAPSNDDE